MPIVPFLAKGLANVLSMGLSISNDFLSYCESFPFTRLVFGQTSILLVAVYFVIIVSILIVWERGMSKRVVSIVVGGFLFVCTCHYAYPYFRESGSVTFIDVGQGDAILIRLPYDKGVYLIDTGGTLQLNKEEWQRKKHEFSIGKDILIPFYKKKASKQLIN